MQHIILNRTLMAKNSKKRRHFSIVTASCNGGYVTYVPCNMPGEARTSPSFDINYEIPLLKF